MHKIRVAVLISGSGSNLQALMDASRAPDYPAEIVLVLSDRASAYGLVRARDAGIPTAILSYQDFASREECEENMQAVFREHEVEFLCLAGFMRILSPGFVAAWKGRMINIHPSLLPKYKGLHTHARALEAGDTEAGCSVHWVTAGVDEGEVILQARVPIVAGDTSDTLAARVLEQEHRIYPAALKLVTQVVLPL